MSDVEKTALATLAAPKCQDVRFIDDPDDLRIGINALLAGSGPLAVDAERASGFKYSQRAYLIQLHRANAPILLIDPIAISQVDPEALRTIQSNFGSTTWLIHAATQDIPCLAELGLRPERLFDTELAGRLLGLERVGLSSMVESILGFKLAKEHSAADWSSRPLPESWLNYAALDVDVLPELAVELEKQLEEANKLVWAEAEFDHLTRFEPKAQKPEKWRGTTGANSLKDPRLLSVVRSIWQAREELGQKLDVSPSRLIPDTSIVELAQSKPKTKGELAANKRFAGRASRSYLDVWWQALQDGLKDRHPPELRTKQDGMPNHRIWANKFPEADARLTALKIPMAEIASEVGMPSENVLTPDYMRQVAWNLDLNGAEEISRFISGCGARPWQAELVSERFSLALNQSQGSKD